MKLSNKTFTKQTTSNIFKNEVIISKTLKFDEFRLKKTEEILI
jgi:hypothetical protein